jgi:glycosyltransferase involved in cell wall biosynthesis
MTDPALSPPPLRVLFVIGSMGGGGAERQLLELLEQFDRSRFTPALYLAYRRGELLEAVPPDVPIFAFDDPFTNRRWRQQLLAKFRCPSAARAAHLSQILEEHSVDLIFAWGLRCAWETAAPARRWRVPRIVYCCVDPLQELLLESPVLTPWRHWQARSAYASADRVLANADALRERLIEFYRLPAARVETFLNLRNFARLDAQADAFHPTWPSDGVKLLTVGRLHPQKGHAVLLDAMTDLVKRRGCAVQLLVVGQGPEEAELKARIHQLGLTDRVAFVGYASNPAPYYRHADVFVLPSFYEGAPNVLLEAAALGVPCVAADCPTGPHEILEGGRVGRLVPPGDAGALADALLTTCRDLTAARETAAKARDSVRTRYGVASGLPALERQLTAVVNARRGGSPQRSPP